MEDLTCYYNGDYMKESEVKIPLMDLGFRHGNGVFDFSRTYNHIPFFWEEHVDRLYRSLRYAHIDPGLTPEEMLNISHEVFKRNEKGIEPGDDYGMFQIVTAGAPAFHAPPTRPNVLVRCLSLKSMYEWQTKVYQEGIPLLLVSFRQIPPECWDVRVKSLSRMHYDLAKLEASLIDPEAWPLLLDTNGRVAEAHTANVFIVKHGKLLTPKPYNILVSITRNVILRLAKQEGIESVEADLYPYDLYNADEVFLTHTASTIVPVNKFNHTVMPKPVPGPITQQLLFAFGKLVGVDIVQHVINYVQAKAKATKKRGSV